MTTSMAEPLSGNDTTAGLLIAGVSIERSYVFNISRIKLSVLAVMVNVGGILTVVTRKRLRNSFGIICASHCVGDTLVGLVTLGWCSPLVISM